MLLKLYGFSVVEGTTKYDLESDDGIKIEVKFSKAEYTEDDMNLNNSLIVCMNNANPISRRISYVDFLDNENICFDRNIEQIKAYEFGRLYYGLFFEDQIAIFSMSSEELKDIMTAQFFISPQKSSKLSVDKSIDLIVNFLGRKDEIKKAVGKTKKKLEDIENSNNQYAEDTKNYIVENEILEHWNRVVLDIKVNGLTSKSQLDKILNIGNQYIVFCQDNFADTRRFPNISPFQHRGNDKAEGQIHINNENLKWHIEESGFFCGWISYKDLYELLKTQV